MIDWEETVMITKIKTMMNGTIDNDDIKNYLTQLGQMVIKCFELNEKISPDYFNNTSFEELKTENEALYSELKKHYDSSYANPEYAISIFEEELGQLLSVIYTDYYSLIPKAFIHDEKSLDSYGKYYLTFAALLTQATEYDVIKDSYKKFKMDTMYHRFYMKTMMQSSPKNSLNQQMMIDENYEDLRYLFKYGLYITDNEIKTAEFLNKYDPTELKDLMSMTAKAYVKGFEADNKDVTLRNNVQVRYNIGQEKMIAVLIEAFKDHNLTGFYGGTISTPVNKQFDYDHRFDDGVYLDKDFNDFDIQTYCQVLDDTKDITLDYSGIMYFDKFGETPFAPESKKTNVQYSDEQNKLSQEMKNKARTKADEYYKETETSFCIIAFPVPEIGEKFEEIYADTCLINKLTSEEYLPIQKCIIDALDESAYVHVKGIEGNKTDIKVMHGKLNDPEKESNYFNCGADVNIPVGEVFTSPVLKGTNGLLHLDVVYLDELKYIDLELTFKDGYVTEYTCKNFDNEEENKKYIEENLLFPHKTLPLGEFAIGTNTLAYVIAEKHNIVDILPVLIVEKMGPHFAIGDTCYSYAEDIDVFNPDGKCIIARDNERSILRKDDLSKAYTNVHTDITLPYDSLAFIDGVKSDGSRIQIIHNGRFVLPGTEALNKPFE